MGGPPPSRTGGFVRAAAPLALLSALSAACARPACRCGPADPGPAEHSFRSAQYRWINPLLDCAPEGTFRELRLFRGKVEALRGRAIAEGAVASASIYFRDLNNGPWFGLDEKALFAPASMQKLPLMMGLLKRAETDPSIMARNLAYRGEVSPVLAHAFRRGEPLRPGDYEAADLLRRAIIDSDNDAAYLLLKTFGIEDTLRVYDDLGIPTPPEDLPGEMSLRDYARIFRVLYNAAYLSRAGSEKALAMLAETTFREGLVAGVPSGVTVAHKFGERSMAGGERQLHDCGIVYFPGAPYLVCVMTRGREFAPMARFIEEVSRTVYGEVLAQRPPP